MTDLDLLLEDFANKEALASSKMDLFEFASRFYGEKSFRRKDQTVRGTVKGLKTAFSIRLSETEDRLDPAYCLFRTQAGSTLEKLEPIGDRVWELKNRQRIITDDDKDREFAYASVSSDGSITLDEGRKGEEFKAFPKKVSAGDFIYNPMRVNIGSIGIVPKSDLEMVTSPDYVVFRADGVNANFLLNILRSPFYRMYIDIITTGSIRDRLYFKDLQALRIPDTPDAVQTLLSEFGRRVDEESRDLLAEIRAQRSQVNERLHSLVREVEIRGSSASVSDTFRVLADRWKRETAIISSITKKIKHPAYREIVGLGEAVVTDLLCELVEHPDHWFSALEEITGRNPVGEADRMDIKRATQAWLAWAHENGFALNV